MWIGHETCFWLVERGQGERFCRCNWGAKAGGGKSTKWEIISGRLTQLSEGLEGWTGPPWGERLSLLAQYSDWPCWRHPPDKDLQVDFRNYGWPPAHSQQNPGSSVTQPPGNKLCQQRESAGFSPAQPSGDKAAQQRRGCSLWDSAEHPAELAWPHSPWDGRGLTSLSLW